MELPLHPIVVHFPIAITIILPILVLVFAFMIKANKMSHHAWLIIIGLQIVTTASGYYAMETGEDEEEQVERVVAKKIIHEHEEAAEVFVGSMVVALVLSIAAFFLRKDVQFLLQLGIFVIGLVSCYLVYQVGETGGEMVYRHGAASAYLQEGPQGILPTPGMNTSESPLPDNESLKKDDNDYGGADQDEIEDEESKIED